MPPMEHVKDTIGFLLFTAMPPKMEHVEDTIGFLLFTAMPPKMEHVEDTIGMLPTEIIIQIILNLSFADEFFFATLLLI